MDGDLWKDAKTAVELLAPQAIIQDSNGITLYFFGDEFSTNNNVKTESDVIKLFNENSPGGQTHMTAVMDTAIRPEKVGRGESILVITDGSPNNIETLENKIVDYTKEMKSKSELSISFIQIGKNHSAKRWLKGLSKRLLEKKAEYDIVDVATTED